MKKKVWIPLAAVALVMIILFTPFLISAWDDGGTVTFTSLTYTIVSWKQLHMEISREGEIDYSGTYEHVSIYWFWERGEKTLWELEMERNNLDDHLNPPRDR